MAAIDYGACFGIHKTVNWGTLYFLVLEVLTCLHHDFLLTTVRMPLPLRCH